MKIEDIKNDIRYGLYILERTGLSESALDRIKSAIKNSSADHTKALDLIYAEDVN